MSMNAVVEMIGNAALELDSLNEVQKFADMLVRFSPSVCDDVREIHRLVMMADSVERVQKIAGVWEGHPGFRETHWSASCSEWARV